MKKTNIFFCAMLGISHFSMSMKNSRKFTLGDSLANYTFELSSTLWNQSSTLKGLIHDAQQEGELAEKPIPLSYINISPETTTTFFFLWESAQENALDPNIFKTLELSRAIDFLKLAHYLDIQPLKWWALQGLTSYLTNLNVLLEERIKHTNNIESSAPDHAESVRSRLVFERAVSKQLLFERPLNDIVQIRLELSNPALETLIKHPRVSLAAAKTSQNNGDPTMMNRIETLSNNKAFYAIFDKKLSNITIFFKLKDLNNRLNFHYSLSGISNVIDLSWSSQGKFFAYSTPNQLVVVNNETTVKSAFFPPNSTHIIAWSNEESNQIATADTRGNIYLWDAIDKKLINNFPVSQKSITSVSWSSDNSIIAITSNDQQLYLWNPKTHKLLHTLQNPEKSSILCGAWQPQGSLFLTGDEAGNITCWDAITGEIIHTRKVGNSAVISLTWDSNIIGALSRDNLKFAYLFYLPTSFITSQLLPSILEKEKIQELLHGLSFPDTNQS